MWDPISPFMLKLKNVIMDCSMAITEKINGVATLVMLLRQNLDKMWDRVKDMGMRVDGMDEIVGTHAFTLTDHEQRLKMLGAKLADLDDRSGHNNVCILGLPEGTESVLVEQFLESWLPTVLKRLESERGLHVDRAHRTPGG
ncbi:hypothetical protein NDU88_001803 [Pleurodeles waltl]|uniref:Uncharacterized protein n=1 Tax=Pleurodeles waltl TaxID=8319 RepID=A0AAV7T0I4_PLEWA|nr:hypothetical protein NDU88_001803 [Pleurodeles waltl]